MLTVFETSRSRLLTAGLLALGVAPAVLLVAALVHVGFCHADPQDHGQADEPLCCEMIEISTHGHHHSGADAEHSHPAALQRFDAAVTTVSLPVSPAPVVATPERPLAGLTEPSRDPPPSPLFLSTHALLL